MFNAKAHSAASATSPLASTTVARRDSNERDVQMEILYCGICHSDLHQVRNEWNDVMPTVYPCVNAGGLQIARYTGPFALLVANWHTTGKAARSWPTGSSV
jgi:uncharacterized zinc-type alcohol dehydrogenase-like protein